MEFIHAYVLFWFVGGLWHQRPVRMAPEVRPTVVSICREAREGGWRRTILVQVNMAPGEASEPAPIRLDMTAECARTGI